MSKTILITGATNGIGKATAELLSAAVHEIIIHARNSGKGEKTTDEIMRYINIDVFSSTNLFMVPCKN